MMRRAMSARRRCIVCVWLSGLAEQLARLRVGEQLLEAGLRRADHAPGDAVARLREAAQRAAQPLHLGQHVLLRHAHVVEEERGGDGRAQRELALDLGRREAARALLDEEAADAVVGLRPHDGDVGDRAVRDPHLRAVDDPVAAVARAWVFMFDGSEPPCGSVSPKQPIASPCAMAGSQRLLLLLGAVGVDRVHARGSTARRRSCAGRCRRARAPGR